MKNVLYHMHSASRISILLCCMLVFTLGAPQTTDDYPDVAYENFTVSDGSKRMYGVLLPEEYIPTQKYPIIMVLHGGGSDALPHYYFPRYEDERNAIIVYPRGLTLDEKGKWRNWNAEVCCALAVSENTNDVLFLYELTKHVSSLHLVTDVFALGYSNGGQMAERLACEYPSLISKVVTISGSEEKFTSCVSKHNISQLNIVTDDTQEELKIDLGLNAGMAHVRNFSSAPYAKIVAGTKTTYYLALGLHNWPPLDIWLSTTDMSVSLETVILEFLDI